MNTVSTFFIFLCLNSIHVLSCSGLNEETDEKVVVSTGDTSPSPVSYIYRPSKIGKEHKNKFKKHEWKDKCTINLKKTDLLTLSIVKNFYGRSVPTYSADLSSIIVLDPESVSLTYLYNKKKPLSAAKKLLKTLTFSKDKNDGELKDLPIRLHLHPQYAELVPFLSPYDKVFLTVITKTKKGHKIKSHFVDSITIDKRYYNHYYNKYHA